MKRGTKRAIALACTAIMAASTIGVLAGCGGGSEVEWFITKDDNAKITLQNNPVLNYWQEQTGLKVKWYDPSSKAEAWAQQLLDGDYSNIVDVGLNANNSTPLLELYDQGIIYDLKPYIEECMPNFNAMLGSVEGDITTNRMEHGKDKDGNLLYEGPMDWTTFQTPVYAKKNGKYYSTTQADGVYTIGEEVTVDESTLNAKMVVANSYIFLVPVIEENPEPWGGYAYRHDMVVDVKGENFTWPSGQPVATTIADWEFIMEAVKEYYTKHNVTGAYPMYLPPEGYFQCGEMIGGFGINSEQYIDNEGNVKYGAYEDEYFEYLTQIKEWYDKGYISPDFSTQQFVYPSADDTNILTGRLGLFFATKGHLGNAFVQNGDIRALANPVKNVGDKALGLISPAATSRASQSNGFMITKQKTNEAKLKKILTALDWFFTEEGSRTRTMGLSSEQGAANVKEYTKRGITNGTRKPNSAEWTKEMSESKTVPVLELAADRMPGVKVVYPQREVDIAAGDVSPWRAYGVKNTYALNYLMAAMGVDMDIMTKTARLSQIVKTYTIQTVLGQKTLTRETFEIFKKELDDTGLNGVITALETGKVWGGYQG